MAFLGFFLSIKRKFYEIFLSNFCSFTEELKNKHEKSIYKDRTTIHLSDFPEKLKKIKRE